MSLALLLYGAFCLERLTWEVEGQRGTPGWHDAVQAWLEAEARMTWVVGRILADHHPSRRPDSATALWSIDVDGVLEDAGLGFPATTPAGTLGLQLARRASAAIVLNSGRSLPELVLRCDALRLDGAVAEYGSAVWDASTGLSESLLDAEGEAGLEAVRMAARDMPDVHVDSRYKHSVRVRRYVGGRLGALATAQVAQLLEAGGSRLRAVQGVRQTDFASVRTDKAGGLDRLRRQAGWRGNVFAIGDSEPDTAVARRATRAYAPRHRDDALAGVAIHLRADRQKAVLEAVRREHRIRPSHDRAGATGSDARVVAILGVRDAPRPVRALRAFGPGLLEAFRT
jgi:hydroxymethylpyrimidine pyrophosphatase-like HAD family hydrolase